MALKARPINQKLQRKAGLNISKYMNSDAMVPDFQHCSFYDYEKEKDLMSLAPTPCPLPGFCLGGGKKGELNQGSEKMQKQKQLNRTRQ